MSNTWWNSGHFEEGRWQKRMVRRELSPCTVSETVGNEFEDEGLRTPPFGRGTRCTVGGAAFRRFEGEGQRPTVSSCTGETAAPTAASCNC